MDAENLGVSRVARNWYGPGSASLEELRAEAARRSPAHEHPLAARIEADQVPVYDGDRLRSLLEQPDGRRRIMAEWVSVLKDGAGIVVIERCFADPAPVDRATTAFERLIAAQHEAGGGAGDHFAKAGANDRVWNALEKFCLLDPEGFARYYANPLIALVSEAWLGPDYQVTSQVNVVKPGGAAQTPHRDYHLGFQGPDVVSRFPVHVHRFSPMLTLQGAVAHCDMPLESGPTLYMPFTQNYGPGYLAAQDPAIRDWFAAERLQLPLRKGDAVFFNPALLHAAGDNRSADIRRMANLLQVSSAYGRAMETVDRTRMAETLFPVLRALDERGELRAEEVDAALGATAEGYSFPTNLDRDPPIGGLAPRSQQALMRDALAERWDADRFARALHEAAHDVAEERAAADVDVGAERHAGDQPEALGHVGEAEPVDRHPRLVEGFDGLAVLVGRESALADPAQPPFRRAVLVEVEGVHLERHGIAAPHETDVARRDVDLGLHGARQGHQSHQRVAFAQHRADGQLGQGQHHRRLGRHEAHEVLVLAGLEQGRHGGVALVAVLDEVLAHLALPALREGVAVGLDGGELVLRLHQAVAVVLHRALHLEPRVVGLEQAQPARRAALVERVAHGLDLLRDVGARGEAGDVVLQLGAGGLAGLDLLVEGPHLGGIFGRALAEQRRLQAVEGRLGERGGGIEDERLVVLLGRQPGDGGVEAGDLLAELADVGLGEGGVEGREQLPGPHALALAHVHRLDDGRVERLERQRGLHRHDLARAARHHAVDLHEGRDADHGDEHQGQQPHGRADRARRRRFRDGVDLRLPLADDLQRRGGGAGGRRHGLGPRSSRRRGHQFGPL